MTNPWHKTVEISTALVKELLYAQFSLYVNEIKLLCEDWDNAAFLINDEFVFRFPHRKEGGICMENEIMLLPYLRTKVSFSLPNISMIGVPTVNYPFSFSGYKMLPGTILTLYQKPFVESRKFAKILANWLRELYMVPVLKNHRNLIKGDHNWRLDVKNRVKRVQEILLKHKIYYMQAGFESDYLVTLIEKFKQFCVNQGEFCYVHGDLYAKHIIVNNRGLPEGLIDWGDVHIGHPANDLSVGFMIFDNHALETFFATYGNINNEMMYIALFRALYHSIFAYAYFCDMKENTSLLWAKAALSNTIKYVENYKTM